MYSHVYSPSYGNEVEHAHQGILFHFSRKVECIQIIHYRKRSFQIRLEIHIVLIVNIQIVQHILFDKWCQDFQLLVSHIVNLAHGDLRKAE